MFLAKKCVGVGMGYHLYKFLFCVKTYTRSNGVLVILTNMKMFPKSIYLQKYVLNTLISLASSPNTHMLVGFLDGVDTSIDLIVRHLLDQNLIDTRFCFFSAISNETFQVKMYIITSDKFILFNIN